MPDNKMYDCQHTDKQNAGTALSENQGEPMTTTQPSEPLDSVKPELKKGAR